MYILLAEMLMHNEKNNLQTNCVYIVSFIKLNQLVVYLHHLTSDMLRVSHLPVCTAGTANRLIDN